MLKKFTQVILLLLLAGSLSAQQTAPAGVPTPAPVDEKTLKFTDAPAQPGGTSGPATTAPPGAADLTFWDFLRMILILAAVVGLIYVFILFLRKLSGQQNPANSPVKILSTTVLSGSRALYLVEIGNEILLVGAGDSAVNLIKPITDQETIDNLRLAATQTPALAKGQFLNFLKKFMGKPEPKDQGEDPVDRSADFLKKQRDRLKKL